ncbi:MAG: hypothetical protein GY861_26230 [bacterium]|nr:hypothetical protein [bacterium]
MAKLGRKETNPVKLARIQAARKLVNYHSLAATYVMYQHVFDAFHTENKMGRAKSQQSDKIFKARDDYEQAIEHAKSVAREHNEDEAFNITSFVEYVLTEDAVGMPPASLLQKLDEQYRRVLKQMKDDAPERTLITCESRKNELQSIIAVLEATLTEHGNILRCIEKAKYNAYDARKQLKIDNTDEAQLAVEKAEHRYNTLRKEYNQLKASGDDIINQTYFDEDRFNIHDFMMTSDDVMVQTAYRDYYIIKKVREIKKDRALLQNLAEQAKKELGLVSLQKDNDDIDIASL